METPKIQSNASDALGQLISAVVKEAVRDALKASEVTTRRLLSIEEGAVHLSLSKREIYNMIANRQLSVIVHGRRKMLDIHDLERWIERNRIQSL